VRAQHSPAGHQDSGHADHQASGHAGHHHGHHDGGGVQLPHGGQITVSGGLTYEVVYRPQEIRVFLYGETGARQTARGVEGEVVLQVRNASQPTRVPLRYVASPARGREQDYLAAAVNLSRIKDGDMTVTFNLENLPLSDEPQTSFTQTFALTPTKLRVTVAALTDADRAQIARQQVCPVMGGKLGSMGAPVKVLVGDHVVYLCCKGCLSKLEKAPEQYLAKVQAAHGHGSH
jgi:hypothetical protein